MWFRLASLSACVAAWSLVAALLPHKSLRAAVFGRYSVGFALLVVGALAMAAALSYLQFRPAYEKLYALRYKLLLAFGSSVIFGVGLLEISFRVFDLFGASFYQEVTRCMLDFADDPDLAYRHRYNFHAKYQGVDVSTNQIGLRERPLEPKKPGRLRILVLGDSVTFGWGVKQDETFSRRLEGELAARYNVAAETINSGVCGYNTVQEYAFLRTRGAAIDPDMVVLMYVDNDVEPVEPIRRERTVALWHDGPSSYAQRLLRATWSYRVAYHLIPFVLSRPSAPVAKDGSWRDSMNAVAGIAQYCHNRGIPFAVFLYRMNLDPKTNAIYHDLAEAAGRERFMLADVQPWFRDRNPREYVNSVLDAHPNAKGHQVIAAGIADSIGSTVAEPAVAHTRAVSRQPPGEAR